MLRSGGGRGRGRGQRGCAGCSRPDDAAQRGSKGLRMARMPDCSRARDDGACNAREQVGVLVCVDVRELEAGPLQLLDLCERFALDVVLTNGAAKNAEREVAERVAEGAAVRAEQCRDGGGIRDRSSVDEDDVTADAEGGTCEGECDGVVESRAVGHQGCGGDRAGVVQLGDGAVNAGRETEVVRIDNEPSCHRDEMRTEKAADDDRCSARV